MELIYNGLKFIMTQQGQTYIIEAFDDKGYKVGRTHAYIGDCSFNGNVVKAMVIGCVHTATPYRRTGMARKTFEMLEPVIRENNVLVSYLHPFSFPYYRMMGYERVSDHRVLELAITDLDFVERYPYLEQMHLGDDMAPLDQVYNKFSEGRNVMIRRYDSVSEDIKVVVPRYMYGNPNTYGFKGKQFYLSRDEAGNPDGYVMLSFQMPLQDHWLKDGILHVEEMCFTTPQALQKLFGFLRMYEGQYDFVRFDNVGMSPEVERMLRRYKYTKISILPDISGRIHDVAGALEANVYPREKGSFTVKVTDCPKSPFSKELTEGVWQVTYENGKGQVTRLADDAQADLEADMPAFVQLIHGYESYGAEVARYMHGVTLNGDCNDFFRAFPNRPAGGYELY